MTVDYRLTNRQRRAGRYVIVSIDGVDRRIPPITQRFPVRRAATVRLPVGRDRGKLDVRVAVEDRSGRRGHFRRVHPK
jgi:hypothetical protein